MAVTRRGKVLIAIVVVVLAAAGTIAVLALTGSAPEIVKKAIPGDQGEEEVLCPLTGLPVPGGALPDRATLAVKIENAPEARPQAGLESADIVYEEPVEGGVTRFIAIYLCGESSRLGPIRSARTTDPDVLVQYGGPVFAYSGGANAVTKAVAKAQVIIDVNYEKIPGAYTTDPSREAPHNVYSTTAKLLRAAKGKGTGSEAVFTYSEELEVKSRRARTVNLYFSDFSDVVWKYSGGKGVYTRFHGSDPHRLEGGPVETTNVVIQVVKAKPGKIVDVTGAASPDVELTGSGKAFVMRDGRVVSGKWERKTLAGVTTFTTRAGEEIPLRPGQTWVELYPADRPKPAF